MMEYKVDKLEISLSDEVLRIISSYKQFDRGKHESGGILLGQIKENRIYIIRCSTQTKFDRSSRTSFERNKDIAQIVIDHEFRNSGGKTIYIGEWHTHPEDIPTPSGVDRKMIIDQFNRNILNEQYVLLLIQGRKGFYLGIYSGNELVGININE